MSEKKEVKFVKTERFTKAWKSKRTFFLAKDNWDDHGFKTTYIVSYCDSNLEIHDIGEVKIAREGQTEGWTKIPNEFDKLDDDFFSLGQSPEYYEKLSNISKNEREEYFKALGDVVFDIDRFYALKDEKVLDVSFLRHTLAQTVEDQFRRIVNGGDKKASFNFEFIRNSTDYSKETVLEFKVIPDSMPPTNVHVLIGSNGVGKTHTLHSMTQAFIASDNEDRKKYGSFRSIGTDGKVDGFEFEDMVSVAFSAFDPFIPPNKSRDGRRRYTYVGLKKVKGKGLEESGKQGVTTGSSSDEYANLAEEFAKSLRKCVHGSQIDEWLRAIAPLEHDTVFRELGLAENLTQLNGKTFSSEARRIFDKLSSGHSIVLLTITKLVETVQEKTLVLLDEPESHLHPPLLSAFVRSLSKILGEKNGVAIVATHSPVVLQEVPRDCVSCLYKYGRETKVERPSRETFGENLGSLTKQVFGLDVERTGYHSILEKCANEAETYDEALEMLSGKLGSEGKSILRSLVASKA